jgi:hypothetical protein
MGYPMRAFLARACPSLTPYPIHTLKGIMYLGQEVQ